MKLQQLSALVPFLAALAAAADRDPKALYCDMLRVEPKPAPYRCGSLKSPFNLNHLLDTPDVSTRRECARACHDDHRCKAFTWDPTSPECRLFDANGKTMAIQDSIDGVTQFWNSNCFECRARRFAVKVTRASEPYNGRYLVMSRPDPSASFWNNQLSDQGDYSPFNILNDGTLVSADDNTLGSWQDFDSNGGDPPKNRGASNIRFMTSDVAGQDAKNIPVKCSIDRSYRFTCYSAMGASFYGCDNSEDVTGDTSGWMMAQSLATNKDLHSKNCFPIKMKIETLFDEFVNV